MAILPIQTNDSTQPLRGLDMKLVRFDYMEIHPIHVCLSHAVNYSLSLLIWHHWTKMNAVQSIISNRNMSLPSAYEANSKQGRFAFGVFFFLHYCRNVNVDVSKLVVKNEYT